MHTVAQNCYDSYHIFLKVEKSCIAELRFNILHKLTVWTTKKVYYLKVIVHTKYGSFIENG